jgi:hypothetical protein
MKVLRAGAFAAAAALVVLAAVAIAATKTIHDPTGDVNNTPLPNGVGKRDVDITKASAGKANGKIELTMRVDGSMNKALSDPGTAPSFLIKAPGPTFYQVYKAGTEGYIVFNNSDPGGPTPSAKLSKPDSHTASVTFKPDAIGNPSNYHWAAVNGYCQVYDRAPDTGFTSSKSAKRC